MGLNESKGNMYRFVTHTWNTVKGQCPHGCTYCYMKRWGAQRPVRFDEKELKTDLESGNFIFVGSSCDMWADAIPSEWIEKTLEHCSKHYNRYLFQSKNPARFLAIRDWAINNFNVDGDFLSLISLCATIETNRSYPAMNKSPLVYERAHFMNLLGRYWRYVTIEPIMDFDLDPMVELIKVCQPEQVNIGADSGNNGLPEPSKAKVLALIEALQAFTIVNRKANLKRIIGV